MTILLYHTPMPPPSATDVCHTSSGTNSISQSDWWNASAAQQDVTSALREEESCSLETLRISVVDGLHSLKQKWAAIDGDFRGDARDTPLPGAFDDINRLAQRLQATAHSCGNDHFEIDALIGNFQEAIGKIYRSRQLPWGTWKSIESQQALRSFDRLTPNAKAAHTALSHIESAIQHMSLMLDAAQCAETQSKANSQVDPSSSEALANRQLVARAFVTNGRLLNRTGIAVNHFLSLATSAIPKDRRRWKTKIAVLVTLSMLTVTLGVASVLVPPLLPTILGMGIALKVTAMFVGILGTTNSVCNIVGYPRNRGWDDLTNCITKVRNLHVLISCGLNAGQFVECSREEIEIDDKLKQLNQAVTHLDDVQTEISKKIVVT